MKNIFLPLFLLLMINFKSYSQLPQKINNDNQIIIHDGFILSYNETCEQPNWVFYKVSKDDFNGKKVKRTNRFKNDTLILTKSAKSSDYKHSGYDRGHLKPAGDEPINKKQMGETFNMSNVSPQVPSFNRGMWRRLENHVRCLVKTNDSLYVISGGVLIDSLKLLKNEICVPEYFFKVIYQFNEGKTTITCYLMENKRLYGGLSNYLTTISIIECRSKLKFLIKTN